MSFAEQRFLKTCVGFGIGVSLNRGEIGRLKLNQNKERGKPSGPPKTPNGDGTFGRWINFA